MITWKGVYPAITTKFTADDKLDLNAFQHNLSVQLNAGVHGIVLAGSLGEASTLTEAEKQLLVKASLEVVENKIPVVMTIAEQSTKVALETVAAYNESGIEGLMVLPPLRYNADDAETLKFFKEVANATDLPIMIYNNPIDYKILVTLDMFEELAAHANIQAVKESTRQLSHVTKMNNRFGDRFKILCGVDPLAYESLALGADGWVAGLVCAFPHETVAIYNLIQDGKFDEALKIYRWFFPLLELDIHPKLVQYIKLAETVTGLGTEHVRAPRMPLEGEERERVLEVIQTSLSSRPAVPLYERVSI